MSGSYQDTSVTADDADALTTGIAAAIAATKAAQSTAARFIITNGAAASGGHADVTGPAGEPADNDAAGVDASDA